MNIIKNIIKTLFILILIISCFNVYGYNLKYRAKYLDPAEATEYVCEITSPVKASAETIADYERARSEGKIGKDGWVEGAGYNTDTYGSARSFASAYLVFAASENFTIYNSGFDTSSSNATNNNIYYDTYSGNIEEGFSSLSGFSGVAANVPENQSTRTNNCIKMDVNDTSRVIQVRWKVTNDVVIEIYALTDAAMKELIEKFGVEAISTKGIKFSYLLRTIDERLTNTFQLANKQNMDTAWVYFQVTVGFWNSGGRGFTDTNVWLANGTSPHDPGASVANLFDNILVIPYKEKEDVKREVYINHVDEDGKILNEFTNSKLDIVDSGNKVIESRANSGPKRDYKEYYTIEGEEGLRVVKSEKTKIGEKEYVFVRAESGRGITYEKAQDVLKFSKLTWSVPYTIRTDVGEVNDVVVVKLIYKEVKKEEEEEEEEDPPVLPSGLPPLEIIGRLEFINKKDNEYINSTKNPDQDYIPSTKELTSYIQEAYPYAVRALRYETKEEEKSITATITVKIKYDFDEWEYRHGNLRQFNCSYTAHTHSQSCYGYNYYGQYGLICGMPYHVHTGIEGSCYQHVHDSTCDWYLKEKSTTISKPFNYTVPYKRTWFDLSNFKMYRITKVEVHDNDTNVGGQLFSDGDYEIDLSDKYEGRFDNSKGIQQGELKITFPSSGYDLPSVDVYKQKPSNNHWITNGTIISSEVEARDKALAELNKETHKTASDKKNLTISYKYENDYVELDGDELMLKRIPKAWSERITEEVNSEVRELDTTKEGTGKTNGADVKYTSNLMNYMKPPKVKRTTIDDFIEDYKTVPQNRENGLRNLKGKIFYEITDDSKYNLGTKTFTSTDATYQLDNLVNVSDGDFKKYDKIYEDDDVNKVTVLTPINFGTFELITDKKVDHSTGAGSSTILQKNAKFIIKPEIVGSTTAGYQLASTREFVEGFWFTFDFDTVVDKNGDNIYETALPASQSIYIAGKDAQINAKTTQSYGEYSADQFTNKIKIVAVTHNVTEALQNFYKNQAFTDLTHLDPDNNKINSSGSQNQSGLLTRSDIVNDANHAIYKLRTTRNLGRIFDFAVTDCSDIAFKDAFRRPVSGTVNEHNTVAYYGGYKKWDLYNPDYNYMVNRSNPKTILPLGPYKHTDTRYVNAPKMGYRISYDLKTTGFMRLDNTNDTRIVTITPSYYYISKNGDKFDNKIKLYFKNSNGKYVDFATSGYTIFYKPNDGYRYLRNSAYADNNTYLSTKLEPITVTNMMTLGKSTMSINNTSFIQVWYGEYKLPNSTIAISNIAGDVHNNVNNPYTDGYIGVIFDIKCIDTGLGAFTLSYSGNDKSASPSTNTSQWDYEGFMNFSNPGSAASGLSCRLEKNNWLIDDARYQEIKGTVVLFDLDNRAASDFE